MLTDIHTHLNHFKTDEIKKIINTFPEPLRIITCAYNIKTLKKTLPILKTFKNTYLSLGLHPQNSTEEEYKKFMPLLEKNLHNIIAIGETGYDNYPQNPGIKEQQKAFRKHLQIAKENKLPLIIHCRKAFEELFQDIDVILGEEKNLPVILHAYSGGFKYLDIALKKGFYISFGGTITFRRSRRLKKIASIIPPEKIVYETDSPFIPPEIIPPVEKSNSAHIKVVLKSLAEARQEKEETVKKQIESNISNIFNFKKLEKDREKWITSLEESLKELKL